MTHVPLASLGSRITSMAATAAAVALLILGVFSTSMSAQETGTVVGTVVQQGNGRPLGGARVQVLGAAVSAMTSNDGRFRLLAIPAGSRTLEIAYLGRETFQRMVEVGAGETQALTIELAAAPMAIEGIEVLGFRAMTQARALSEQKNARNIVNVVASDQIGRFPDASAPEALQRVPGVALERDQGEGRYVLIRGGAKEFTNVSINGASVPAPEGDNRQVALDAVPVDILESIEVTKAITPDRSADAIGGGVNLITRKAPAQRLISGELAGGYAPVREELAGTGSLTFGDRFGPENRFGLLVSGSWSNRQFGSDDIEPEYDFANPGLADDVLVEFQTRHYTLGRRRIGGTASLDYRLSSTSEIQLTGTYSEHRDTEERRVMNNVLEDNELLFEHKNRREFLEIGSLRLEGEHVLGSALQLDWGLSGSRSGEDTPYDSEIFFIQEDVTFSPDMSDPDRIRPGASSTSYQSDFVFNEIDRGESKTTDTDLIGHADLSVPYTLSETTSGRLQFGFQVRDKTKDREVTTNIYELAGGSDIVLGRDIGVPFSNEGFVPGDYPFVASSTTGDEILDFPTRFGNRLDGEQDIEEDTEDYDLQETVTAGYLMTELNFGDDFLFLPGVRYETTDYQGDGFEFDSESETLSPVTAEQDYDNWFPMAHLRYRLDDGTNLRAAYTSAIARPNYFDLIPFRIRDDEDLELGNPNLKPTTSRNVDVIVERFDERIGLLSAGLFAKWLDDPIFVFVAENDLGGDTEQPGNGESGWIRGMELALQQQLTFLPGALSGLGIYANYTYTDSEGTLPSGREAQLLGQADHTVNAALSYEFGSLSSQLSLNWRDAYIDEYGDDTVEDEYVGSRHQLDLQTSWRVRNGAVFVELNNLTDQPFVLFQGDEDRPRQIEYYEPWGQIGFRYSLR